MFKQSILRSLIALPLVLVPLSAQAQNNDEELKVESTYTNESQIILADEPNSNEHNSSDRESSIQDKTEKPVHSTTDMPSKPIEPQPAPIETTTEKSSQENKTSTQEEAQTNANSKISSSSDTTTLTQQDLDLTTELQNPLDDNQSLIIDSSVTSFSNIHVSDSLHNAAGTISLNGDLALGDKQVHPVYKFKLVNDEDTAINNATVSLPFPEGYILDESFPQTVLITPNNKNPKLADISYTLTEGKDGLLLTLPDMEPGEDLHFDVKFFLIKQETDLEEETEVTAEIKEKLQLDGTVSVNQNGEEITAINKILISNDNLTSLQTLKLHIKVPEGLIIDNIKVNGIDESQFSLLADGTIELIVDELKAGQNIIEVIIDGVLDGSQQSLSLPVSLLADEEVIHQRILSTPVVPVVVETPVTDEENIEQEETTGSLINGGTADGATFDQPSGTVDGDISDQPSGIMQTKTNEQTVKPYAYTSQYLPKTGAVTSSMLYYIIGLVAVFGGILFYRRSRLMN